MIYLLLILLIFSACNSENQPEPLIAQVGGLTISAYEFEQHYQYNPHLTKHKTAASGKNEILAALIAQKLLPQQNSSPSPAVKAYEAQFHREALIEALWEEKIAANIVISEDEISRLHKKSKTKKIIRYYTFADSASAQRAIGYINNDSGFTSYGALIGLRDADIPVDTIIAGKSLPALEDVVYRMSPGEVSGPVKIGRFFFVIDLHAEIENIFHSYGNLQNEYARLAKVLKRRKKEQSFKQFIKTNYPERPYHLQSDTFKKMAHFIESRIDFSAVQPAVKTIQNFNDLEIDFTDFDRLTVISFSDGSSWSTVQLYNRLKVSPYPIILDSPGTFRSSIILATKNILDDEILVMEAQKLGLTNSAYVHSQHNMWKDHLNALDYRQSLQLTNAAQDSLLVKLLSVYPVSVNHDNIRSLKDSRTNMAVFKTHFPVRTIVPGLLLTEEFPVYRNQIRQILIQ